MNHSSSLKLTSDNMYNCTFTKKRKTARQEGTQNCDATYIFHGKHSPKNMWKHVLCEYALLLAKKRAEKRKIFNKKLEFEDMKNPC